MPARKKTAERDVRRLTLVGRLLGPLNRRGVKVATASQTALWKPLVVISGLLFLTAFLMEKLQSKMQGRTSSSSENPALKGKNYATTVYNGVLPQYLHENRYAVLVSLAMGMTAFALMLKRARLMRAIQDLDETKPGPGFTVARATTTDKLVVKSIQRDVLRDKLAVGDIVLAINGEPVTGKKGVMHLLRGRPRSTVHVRLLRHESTAPGVWIWSEWVEKSDTFVAASPAQQPGGEQEGVYSLVLERVPKSALAVTADKMMPEALKGGVGIQSPFNGACSPGDDPPAVESCRSQAQGDRMTLAELKAQIAAKKTA